MKDDSLKTKTIEWLRFYCAYAVVVQHSMVGPFADTETVSLGNGIFDTVRIIFTYGIFQVAVPIFFLYPDTVFFII